MKLCDVHYCYFPSPSSATPGQPPGWTQAGTNRGAGRGPTGDRHARRHAATDTMTVNQLPTTPQIQTHFRVKP